MDQIKPFSQPLGRPDRGAPIITHKHKSLLRVSSRPTRILFNYNPTPVFDESPLWRNDGQNTEPDTNGNYRFTRVNDSCEYMLRMGFESSFMVYNGTLKRHKLWWSETKDTFRALPDVLNRFDLDWTKEGKFDEPVTSSAARACVKLSRNPWTFGANLPPYRPITLDIEYTSLYNSTPSTPTEALSTIREWTKMFRLFRQEGLLTELFSYMPGGLWPAWQYNWDPAKLTPDELTSYNLCPIEDLQMMSLLSGITIPFYNWDLPTENPGIWMSLVEQQTGLILEKYPRHFYNKFAVIQPQMEFYFPDNIQDLRNRKKENKLIPLDLWEFQLRFLVDRGWNLFLWITQPLEKVKPYLDVAARYVVNY